ncbi:hypothetical protein [Mesorhizobium sp. RIZ17]|uniref:hypothetical protein n=1 Tax=Mesorhizobium sp. RIZ17 TaxID=3132743 RepID=UPI003DA83F9E
MKISALANRFTAVSGPDLGFLFIREKNIRRVSLALSAIEAHTKSVDLVEFGFRPVGAAPILSEFSIAKRCVVPARQLARLNPGTMQGADHGCTGSTANRSSGSTEIMRKSILACFHGKAAIVAIRVVRRFGSAASDGPQPQGILLISTKRPGRVFPAPRNAAAFIHLPAIVRTVGLAR